MHCNRFIIAIIFSDSFSPRTHNLSPFTYCARFDVQNVDDFLCAFFVVLVDAAAVESVAAAGNVCSCQHNCSVIALNVAFMLGFSHIFIS